MEWDWLRRWRASRDLHHSVCTPCHLHAAQIASRIHSSCALCQTGIAFMEPNCNSPKAFPLIMGGPKAIVGSSNANYIRHAEDSDSQRPRELWWNWLHFQGSCTNKDFFNEMAPHLRDLARPRPRPRSPAGILAACQSSICRRE